jgi:hypothetical protein
MDNARLAWVSATRTTRVLTASRATRTGEDSFTAAKRSYVQMLAPEVGERVDRLDESLPKQCIGKLDELHHKAGP